MGGLGSGEQVFAFESRPRIGESLNEQGWAGAIGRRLAVLTKLVGALAMPV
jgi:hypothetical protein